jgi:hypothetical protein
MRTQLTAISFGLAVAAAVFLLVWPAYTGFDGQRATHATLLQINRWWTVVPVMFPVLVSLIPLAVRVVAAVVMGVFGLIIGSIGLFYLPAGILMLLAACVEDSARLRDVW